MRQSFKEISMSAKNKEALKRINSIISEYQAEGYVLTLRQLYYHLVSRGIIPNENREYKKLSRLLTEGRLSGVVDWAAIEDRIRVIREPATWKTPKDILLAASNQYAIDRHDGQLNYIEVWVEKDALSQVVERAANPYRCLLW